MKHEQKLKQALQELETLKSKITNLIKPELQVGKWYKGTSSCLIFVTDIISDTTVLGYGFDVSGRWVDKNSICITDTLKEAAWESVRISLIEEAEKRGFSIGCQVKAEWINTTRVDGTIKDSNFVFEGGTLLFLNHYLIFKEGQWADVIKPEKSCPLNDDIQSLKDKHPEYNFTIIAEKK